MSMIQRFNKRYKSGDTPWDLGKPDFNLKRVVLDRPVQNCRALEIGCGTGDNAVWLARQGFIVTAFDGSELAVETARQKMMNAGVSCTLHTADFMKTEIPGKPFDFLFDRGCFHSFETRKRRDLFAKNAATHLTPGGLWLSLLGNKDETRHDSGPPRRSALDIVSTVEKYFQILFLESGHFGSKQTHPHMAWICLFQKR